VKEDGAGLLCDSDTYPSLRNSGLSRLISSNGSHNRSWTERIGVINTTKCSNSGFDISDQCVFRESFNSSGPQVFYYLPSFYDMGKLDQITDSLTFLTLITLRNIFYIVSQYTPKCTHTKLKQRFIFSILFCYSILKLPSKLISHLLMGQLLLENPGFDCRLPF